MQIGGALVAVAVAGAGLGVGFAVQRSADEGSAGAVEASVSRPASAVRDCPGGDIVGAVHAGDRVFATARHEDVDGWLLIRDPLAPSTELWILAEAVEPDAGTDDLPEIGCGEADELALILPTTTSSTVPGETTTTSSTVPGETTTTAPGTSSGGGPTGPGNTTTTTVEPDTTKPTLQLSQPSPTDIYEHWNSTHCGEPETSVIKVAAEDRSGIALIRASWAVGQFSEEKVVTQGEFVVGPYNWQTVPDRGSQTMTITVTAKDRAGNSISDVAHVTLHSFSNCWDPH